MRPVIGLTGSIAAGKSTAAKILRRLGYAVFDADAVVACALGPGGAAAEIVCRRMPEACSNGVVDKRVLARRATSDDAIYAALETILHPLVYAAAGDAIRQARRPLILDIPLLFETGGARYCDSVMVVDAAAPIRRARALRRPGVTAVALDRIEARQTPAAVKRRLADHLIRSGLDRRALRAQLRAALRRPRRARRRLSPAHRRALGDHAMRRPR